MENLDHTVVQDAGQQQQSQQLSLVEQSAPLSEAPDIPGYLLRKPLGRGSFGEVWEATQSGSGQKVAVKVFTHPGGLDWRYLQHEIARLRQVAEHPHVVTLHDADFNHEPPYFCMGLYRESLSDWRRRTDKVTISQVVEWFFQLARALQYTHEKGLLHCDFKPANVLLDEEGRVRVADFGQAVERGLPGSAVGSLGYMAPEQASLEATSPDVRWDIYGLGATIYFLLTGRPPRLSDQDRETMGSITDPTARLERYQELLSKARLHPLRELNSAVDEDLAQLVTSMLALDPEKRPQSAAMVIEDLKRRADGRPLLCRQPWPYSYRCRRFARRHRLALVALLVLLCSLASLAHNAYQRGLEQRRALARQEFEKGWALAVKGDTAEAALWWARSLQRDPLLAPSRAALNSLQPALLAEYVHGDTPLNSVVFDPSGAWMASAASDGSIKLWQQGKVQHEWPGSGDPNPEGYQLPEPLLAGCGEFLLTPKGVYKWGETEPLETFEGAAHVTPTGVLLVDKEGAEVLEPVSRLRYPVELQQSARRVAFTSEADVMAVLDDQGQAYLYRRGFCYAGPLPHQRVGSVLFSDDGKFLLTTSEDRSAKLWAVATGQELHELDHGWWVVGASFLRPQDDQQLLVTASYNGLLRLWNTQGSEIRRAEMKHAWVAYGAVPSPDGRKLASHSIDGKARVWDLDSGKPETAWLRHGSAVKAVAFTPDGRQLVTAGQDGRLRLWAVRPERKEVQEYQHLPGAELNSVALDPRGELLATGWQEFPQGGGARLWKRSGEPVGPVLPHPDFVHQVCFSPDGERLATACDDGTVRLFTREGELLDSYSHQGAVRSVVFSPDSKLLLSAGEDGSARIWGRQEHVLRPCADASEGAVMDAQFSPDGKLIATGSTNKKTVIWDLDGNQVASFEHDAGIRRVVWSHNGQMVVACGIDGTARLLHLDDSRRLKMRHTLMVVAADFDSQDRRLVTGSLDGSVKLWEVATGKQLPSPDGHEGPVLRTQFSPDDRLLLSVSKDGSAQLWESDSALPFGLPIRHHRLLYDGTFTADGRQVLTGSHDGLAKLTEVPSLQSVAALDELEQQMGFRLHEAQGKCSLERVQISPKTP